MRQRRLQPAALVLIGALLGIPAIASADDQTPQSLEALRTLQDQFAAVAEKGLKSTVAVRLGGGNGSGVIVSADGYVLTAAHVSGPAGRDVSVILHDGRRLQGKTLGANVGVDAGLIKVESEKPLPFAEMGQSSKLEAGSWCVTTGHPGGYQAARGAPVRVGRVLVNRSAAIVTDCALVGGDSGGPLFDLEGRVIGIHSRIGGSLQSNIHVPVDQFRKDYDRLKDGEVWGSRGGGPRPGGPFLGVGPDDNGDDRARIGRVIQGSAAENAGLRVGDVVQRFGGKKVKNFESLVQLIRKRKAGDKVEIEIERNGKTETMKVTLGRFGVPAPQGGPKK